MHITATVYRVLLLSGAIVIAVLVCVNLLRAFLGPRFTDRVLSVNIICTKIIILISILSFLLDNGEFLDVALIYAMVNFLAVVVLSKCYLLLHKKDPSKPQKPDKEDSE